MSEPAPIPHNHVPMQERTIGRIFPESTESQVVVEHVYAPDGSFKCDDCGKPGHDPGYVGLVIYGDGGDCESVLLEPHEALLIANRLQRAASLVLESTEDVPDVEREANRFSVVPDTPGDL